MHRRHKLDSHPFAALKACSEPTQHTHRQPWGGVLLLLETRCLCPVAVTAQVQPGSGPALPPAGSSEQPLPLTGAALEQKLSISEQGSQMNNLNCLACPYHSKPRTGSFPDPVVSEAMPALPSSACTAAPSHEQKEHFLPPQIHCHCTQRK